MAGAISAIGVAVLVYALLAPQPADDQTDHMGYGPHTSYSSGNVLLIAVGVISVVAGLMIIILREEYEPLPPALADHEKGPAEREQAPVKNPDDDALVEKEYLALRLLTGDERTMFKAIMDSGGEALQKDLIVRTRMSNAKVSRLLDRLQTKGVIAKERHGSTNKIRIRMDS